MEKRESFELTPPPTGLLTLEQAAATFGVSRQAFHRWNVQPVRIMGREKLFTLAAVLANRLEAAQDGDTTPAAAELERLEARRELLSEQLEAQHLRNQAARDAAISRPTAAWLLETVMAAMAEHVEEIPTRIAGAVDKAARELEWLEAETNAAAGILQDAALPDPDPGGQGQVYQ